MADWTRVQGTSTQSGGGGTTNSLSFGATVGNGNVVRGAVLTASGAPITNVTDDKGNAYRLTINGDDGSALNAAMFRSLHPVTNAPRTITVTAAVATGTFWIVLDEFAPPTGTTDISLDGVARAFGTNGLVTNNFGTFRPDALIYSVSMSNSVSTTGAGFNAGQGSGTAICTEWAIQSTPASGLNGAYATQTGNSWILADAIVPQAALWEPLQNKLQRSIVNATSGSVSLNNPVANGSIVVGVIAVDSLANLTSLLDDKNNSYTVLSPNTGGRAIYWSNGLITNGPKTITAQVSATSATVFLMMNEIAPPPGTIAVALDGTPTNTFVSNTGAGTSTTSGNITATNSNDLSYSFSDTNNGGANFPSGSQFNGLPPNQQTTWSDAYQLLLTSGVKNVTWNYLAGGGSENLGFALFQAISSIVPAGGAAGQYGRPRYRGHFSGGWRM